MKKINNPKIISILLLLKLNFIKKINKTNIINVFIKFDLSPIIKEIKIKISANIKIKSLLLTLFLNGMYSSINFEFNT